MLSNLSSNFLSPFSEKSFSLFSPLSSAIFGLSKKGEKPMTLSNKFTLSLASLAVLGLLAARSNQTAQTPANFAVHNRSHQALQTLRILKLLARVKILTVHTKGLMKMTRSL